MLARCTHESARGRSTSFHGSSSGCSSEVDSGSGYWRFFTGATGDADWTWWAPCDEVGIFIPRGARWGPERRWIRDLRRHDGLEGCPREGRRRPHRAAAIARAGREGPIGRLQAGPGGIVAGEDDICRRLRGRPPVGDGEEAPHGLSRAQRPAEGHHGRPHTAQAHRRRRPGALPRGRRLGRSAPSARRRAGAREGKRERRGAPQRKDPGRAGARGSGRGGRSRRGREANPRPHGRGPGPHRPGLGARARRQRRRR